jgi:glycerophosphoryl diester phosphodiesterase
MRTRLLSGAALGLMGGVGLYLGMASRPRVSRDYAFFEGPEPRVIAHRGGAGLWPENTIHAFERAVELGVDVLEMDVHATADGELVVIHDPTLDRTTSGTGRVRERSWSEVSRLDAGYSWSADGGHGFPYRGLDIRVPSLAEVFAAFPGSLMNLDIKPRDASVVDSLCRLIRRTGMTERVLVASFHAEAIEAFRSQCPEVATSASPREVRNFLVLQRLYLGRLHRPVAAAFQVPARAGRWDIATARFVRDAKAIHAPVEVFTVNAAEDMKRLVERGVSGIMTDYPDRLLKLLDRN